MKRVDEEDVRFWWLSFAGESGFLGVIITIARNFRDAVFRVNALGINPGGEIVGHPWPASKDHEISAGDVDRLLSRAEIGKFDVLDMREAKDKGLELDPAKVSCLHEENNL
jgi:hypothetical protein